MKLNNILLGLAILLLCSCNLDKKQQGAGSGLPGDFLDFYERFHADSLYQMEHISFPLSGIPAMQLKKLDTLHYFEKEEWRMHRAIPDSAIAYQSIMEIDEGIIEEEIGLREQGITIFRRYSKIGDEWYLIYYMAPNFAKKQ